MMVLAPPLSGVLITGQALALLGLALMIGGMLALGAITAPILFRTLERPDAAWTMTQIFRRYDTVMLAALALTLVGVTLRTWSLVVGSGASSALAVTPVNTLRLSLLALLTGMVVWGTQVLNPQIEAYELARRQGTVHTAQEVKAFAARHKVSESLAKWELLVAVALIPLLLI